MWQIFDMFICTVRKHLKTLYEHHIIALFQEIGLVESNGDVKCQNFDRKLRSSSFCACAVQNWLINASRLPKYPSREKTAK